MQGRRRSDVRQVAAGVQVAERARHGSRAVIRSLKWAILVSRMHLYYEELFRE